jgi:DNA-binding transcriptional MerR regulator
MQTRTPEQIQIPDKLYFRIGEVSKIVSVPTHVLRFWESEFKQIRPKRTSTGQRLYTQRDIRLLLEVKSLLYERRFTIEGARQHLGSARKSKSAIIPKGLRELRAELQQIRDLLKG